MKKNILVLSLLSIFLIINTTKVNANTSKVEKLAKKETKKKQANTSSISENIAKDIVEKLLSKDFEKARINFDDKLSEALSVDKLREAWESSNIGCGDFKKKDKAVASKIQNYNVLTIKCTFEHCSRNVQVVFTSAEKVGGLWIKP